MIKEKKKVTLKIQNCDRIYLAVSQYFFTIWINQTTFG